MYPCAVSYMYMYVLHSDRDECDENNGNCTQICTDTDGSFTCSCHPGYQLSKDRKNCKGKTTCLHQT